MLTAGVILKKERESQKLTLEEVSSATKIQKHFLESLENDEYSKFPSTVYAKGFIQIYSKYLGTDTDKLLALFRRSVSKEEKLEVKESKRPFKEVRFALTPSTLVLISVVVLILFTFGYLFYQFYNFQKPPKLELYYPQNNQTTQSQEIQVEGKTETNMYVTINDEPIRTNEDGSFSVSINLSEGNNTIIVKAKHTDDIGEEAVLTRNIEYIPQKEETIPDVAGEKTTEIKVVVEITKESTWLDIRIDGKPEITSIVLPGTKLEYTIKESFSLTTGKVPYTKVTIDNEEINPYINESGVGIIDCTINKSKVNCQQP